jgi:bacterial/archaeal transporter family-2 protein
MKYVWMLGTLMAGALLPVQNLINTRVGKQTGGALMGVLISFIIGTVVLILINALVNYNAFASVRPSRITPWYLWLGGFMGAAYLGYTTWVNQQQSLALTFVLIVCGQIIMALLIDNYGWLGAVVRKVTLTQVIGVILMLGGVLLVRK